MEVVSLCGILGFCAWEDMRTKEIHILAPILMAVLGIMFYFQHSRLEPMDMLGGIAVGMILYVASILSKEAIGKGDAICFMATGIYLGFWGNLFLLWMSFLLAGVVGTIYGKVRGCRDTTRYPFLPFVFVCMMIQVLAGGTL